MTTAEVIRLIEAIRARELAACRQADAEFEAFEGTSPHHMVEAWHRYRLAHEHDHAAVVLAELAETVRAVDSHAAEVIDTLSHGPIVMGGDPE